MASGHCNGAQLASFFKNTKELTCNDVTCHGRGSRVATTYTSASAVRKYIQAAIGVQHRKSRAAHSLKHAKNRTRFRTLFL